MKIIDYYREIQSEASKEAYKSTFHYLTLKEGNPEPHGSGVFVKVQNEKFALTAAHVIDKRENDIYVPTGPHDLLKLGGDLVTNQVTGLRSEDKIDLSILKLNEETLQKLGDQYVFLEQNELGVNHEFKPMPMYQSVGFPASKSKYNRYKDEIKSVPFIYITMPASQDIYEKLGCESYCNVIVHYDKKNVRDYLTNTISIGPDPFGISGSGLWFTPSQLKASGDKIDKKLVAIMTEWPTKLARKYWIGTRIDLFTEVIRQKFELNIEPSRIVKINLNE